VQEYIYEKDGRKRKARKIICNNCGEEFLRAIKNIGNKNYCSKGCLHASQRIGIEYSCDFCGEKFIVNPSKKNKRGFYFCSRKCKENAQSIDSGDKFINLRPYHYKDGLSKYQDRAYKRYGEVCNKCGYSENKSALQVHHIDGNRENNKIENLEVLCANCHAVETWG